MMEHLGANYFLPNMNAGSFSSAGVGNLLWNQRMFQLHAEGKYIDVFERMLYNALLTGVSLEGTHFFDSMPLESLGRQQRRDWPSSNDGSGRQRPAATRLPSAYSALDVARFIAALPSYIYATEGDAIFLNLYAACTADIELTNRRTVKIAQETKYPWDGAIKLTFTPDQPAKFAINLRSSWLGAK